MGHARAVHLRTLVWGGRICIALAFWLFTLDPWASGDAFVRTYTHSRFRFLLLSCFSSPCLTSSLLLTLRALKCPSPTETHAAALPPLKVCVPE